MFIVHDGAVLEKVRLLHIFCFVCSFKTNQRHRFMFREQHTRPQNRSPVQEWSRIRRETWWIFSFVMAERKL